MTEEYAQPLLGDDLTRDLPLQNESLKAINRFYNVCELKNGRFAAVQITVENNKVKKICIRGHEELEKEFASESLLKQINDEERLHLK